MTYATRIIETLKAPQFQGDMVLAYLWNRAGSALGMENVISSPEPVTEESLRHDVRVVVSRPEYLRFPELQALAA